MLRKGLSVWEGTRSCLGLSCQQWSVIFALGPFFGQCSQKLPKNRKKKSSVRRREKLFGSQLLASDDLHIILTLRPIFFGKCSQKLPKNCKKLLREKAVEVVLDSAACQRWSIILTLQGRWASMGGRYWMVSEWSSSWCSMLGLDDHDNFLVIEFSGSGTRAHWMVSEWSSWWQWWRDWMIVIISFGDWVGTFFWQWYWCPQWDMC